MTAGTEHSQNFTAGYDGRHWVCSAGESLAQDQHIRLDVLGVAGEEMPSAAKAGLNLVCHQQHAFPAADRRRVADETLGRDQDAGFALNRLEQESAGVRSNRLLQRFRVAKRNGCEAGREGPESVAIQRLGREPRDGSGAAVKIVFANDDFSLAGRDAFWRS